MSQSLKPLVAHLSLGDLVGALRRTQFALPGHTRDAFDALESALQTAPAYVKLRTILDLLFGPDDAVGARYQTGWLNARRAGVSDQMPLVLADGSTTLDLIRVEQADRTIGFYGPDFEQEVWRWLSGTALCRVLDRLIKANCRPVGVGRMEWLRETNGGPIPLRNEINRKLGGRHAHGFVESNRNGLAVGSGRSSEPFDPYDDVWFIAHEWNIFNVEVPNVRGLEKQFLKTCGVPRLPRSR